MKRSASFLSNELTANFEAREEELKQAQAIFDGKVQLFEQENKLMSSVPTADNDVLNLNVGGSLICTKRSTLTQAKGTSLAARFSGRWEQCLDRDSQGRIFLDFDPYCFEKLMSYLRARQVDEFWGFIKYMGLEEYMGCAPQPCFVTCDPDVSCNYDGQVVRSGVGTQGNTAVIDVPMSAGEVHYFKIHIQKLGNPAAKLHFGVGKKVDTSAGATMPDTSICGWASPALEIKQGVSSAVNILTPWRTADFVCLKVDLQNWCVALTSSRGTTPVSIELSPDDQDPLVPLVTLYGHGQKVQLVPIESQDQLRFDLPSLG